MTSLAQSVLAQAAKQRDLLQALSEHSNSISVRISSRDQSVSAEVDGAGTLTGLWLGPPATRLDADALARLIVETAQAAAQLALERQAFLFKEFNSRLTDLQKAPLTCWDGSQFVPGKSGD